MVELTPVRDWYISDFILINCFLSYVINVITCNFLDSVTSTSWLYSKGSLPPLFAQSPTLRTQSPRYLPTIYTKSTFSTHKISGTGYRANNGTLRKASRRTARHMQFPMDPPHPLHACLPTLWTPAISKKNPRRILDPDYSRFITKLA
jgi:hypothetical protein